MYVAFSSLPQHFRPRHRLYSSLNCASRSRLHNFLRLSASAQQQLLRKTPLRFDSGNALFSKLTRCVFNIWLLILVLPYSQSHIRIVVYQLVYCLPQWSRNVSATGTLLFRLATTWRLHVCQQLHMFGTIPALELWEQG